VAAEAKMFAPGKSLQTITIFANKAEESTHNEGFGKKNPIGYTFLSTLRQPQINETFDKTTSFFDHSVSDDEEKFIITLTTPGGPAARRWSAPAFRRIAQRHIYKKIKMQYTLGNCNKF